MRMRDAIKNQRGFTLIEMVVVMVLIAALAAVAIPRYMDYRSRARAGEAANIMGALIAEAEMFREINNTYAGFDTSAGFANIIARASYFGFTAPGGDAATVTITATGNGVDANIDATNTLAATLNAGGPTTWAAAGYCVSPTA